MPPSICSTGTRRHDPQDCTGKQGFVYYTTNNHLIQLDFSLKRFVCHTVCLVAYSAKRLASDKSCSLGTCTTLCLCHFQSVYVYPSHGPHPPQLLQMLGSVSTVLVVSACLCSMLVLPEGGPAAAPGSPETTRVTISCTCSGKRKETLTAIQLAPPALGVHWLMEAFTHLDTPASVL